MKLLILLILIGAGALFYPRFRETTDTTCGALEHRVAGLLHDEVNALPPSNSPKVNEAIKALRAWVPTPGTVEAFVQNRLPFLPPEVGCAAAYWVTVVKPDLRDLAPGLLPIRPPLD